MSLHPNRIAAVVDDDDNVRKATAGLVRSMGWQVLAYSSAVHFLESPDIGRIDCLIADVRMPVMSGPELHQALIANGHAIPTIFVTAQPSHQLVARLLALDVLAVLEKPLDADLLEQVLATITGQSAPD